MARLKAGETIRSIAAALAIAPSCVSKWRKRLAETGALTRGRVGGRKQRPCPANGPTGCANAADPARSRRGALWRNWPNAASKPGDAPFGCSCGPRVWVSKKGFCRPTRWRRAACRSSR
ncbi:helix-turn-helix domain-containing protein [Rhizobium leguminosarum]|uniref:helix-turn-helix domain-containing protein n=1 Tax=Rhizobium leguminosarum TaxID=384 RepID=UPI00103127E4|nr:helix-turn-helix domain-containing protein [Rhizobium leguminosarum]TAU91456.1 hypothetical protein ELI41_02380 [Rhizobium leguminosarum]TAV56070.1 hypothetical protein ELI29_02375 [Rhizobium leguminosarum]